MARRLKHDIPGPDWRVEPEQVRARGLPGIFAPELAEPEAVEIEIGYGRGEFLLARAAGRPRVGFLGVELSGRRHLKMARRLARTELSNIRLCRAPAEYLLAECLPASCADRIWINFPDPWPKKRHHRRRLIQPTFAREFARVLAPGGHLEVATDHPEYAAWIAEVLSEVPGLENLLAPAPHVPEVPGRTPTAYELEWRAEGRPLHFFRYRRADPVERPEAPGAVEVADASPASGAVGAEMAGQPPGRVE